MRFNRRLAATWMLVACGGAAALPSPVNAAEASSANPAADAQPSQQEMLQTIRELQARVAELEARQTSPASRPSSGAPAQVQIDPAAPERTVAEMTKDAGQRSQLVPATDFTAGYDNGKFLLQSQDGNFVLHPYLQFLFRHATTFREDSKSDGTGDDIQNGFELRRMKLGFDGNVFTKDLGYHFLWATDRKSGNLVLEEAYGNYKFADEFAVRAGQFKDYFSHEAMSSSRKLFASERSLLNDVFTGGDNFVQGVALLYDNAKDVRAAVDYTDGANAPNQNFLDYPTAKGNFGFSGRFEYKFFGDWKSYEDFTALGNKQDLLVAGGGVDYTEAGDTGTLSHTLDLHYETGPIGAFVAYLGRQIDNGGSPDLYDWGVVAQAGYLIDNKFEPYVRYDFIRFDPRGLAAGLENDVHEFTVGFNYYLRGHSARFTADLSWLPNGAPITNDGSDVLATSGSLQEFILRVQFQLLL